MTSADIFEIRVSKAFLKIIIMSQPVAFIYAEPKLKT